MPTAPDPVLPASPPSNTPAAPGNATGTGVVAAPTAPVTIQAGGAPAAPTAPGNATGAGSVAAPSAPASIQAGGAPAAPAVPDSIQAWGQPTSPDTPPNTLGAYGNYVLYLEITGAIGPYSGGTTTLPQMFPATSYGGMPRWRGITSSAGPGGSGWECLYHGGRWKIQPYGAQSPTAPKWWSDATTDETPDTAIWSNSAAPERYSAGTPLVARNALLMTPPDSIQPGGQPAAPAAPGNATGSGGVAAPAAPAAVQL